MTTPTMQTNQPATSIALAPASQMQVDGVLLRYHDLQPPTLNPSNTSGNAPSIVMLHGWGANAGLMLPVAERLAPLGYRVLVPDLPGFGQTLPPPTAWSVGDYARLIAAWMEQIGLERAHLVGHSFGGRLCLVLGSDYANKAQKIVLVDSAGIPWRRPPLIAARTAVYKWVRDLLHSVGARALGDGLRAWYNHRYGSADLKASEGVMRETFLRVVAEDLRPVAARVHRPTLLVWGELDPDTPLYMGKVLEQIMPDAGLHIFSGAGHYSYLEHQAEFVRICDFFFRQMTNSQEAAH